MFEQIGNSIDYKKNYKKNLSTGIINIFKYTVHLRLLKY